MTLMRSLMNQANQQSTAASRAMFKRAMAFLMGLVLFTLGVLLAPNSPVAAFAAQAETAAVANQTEVDSAEAN